MDNCTYHFQKFLTSSLISSFRSGYAQPCFELLWPTITQNIHTMTHYDPKLRKSFYKDPKQLSISELAPPNTPLSRVSFQTKHFEISRPNLPKKIILGTEFEKEIVEFTISHPWKLLHTEFHSKQSTLKFRDHVSTKKVF